MKIALINEHGVELGGNFQYSLSMMRLFNDYAGPEHSCTVFTTVAANVPVLRAQGIKNVELLRLNAGLRAKVRNRGEDLAIRLGLFPRSSVLDEVMGRHGIDLIWFLNHSHLALKTVRYNFVHPVLDLCHRDCPEFPEVREGRNFEEREFLFRHALPKAAAIVTDSEAGRANIAARYGIEPGRIAVMPFMASVGIRSAAGSEGKGDIDVKAKYGIEGDYIFYPAQFWPHKNHQVILEALRVLEKRDGIALHALFCGSDRGNRGHIEAEAQRLGVAGRIRYAGFVPDEEMPALYRQSLALVMPTYFGPTNIPPLEAFLLRVPVLYSDLPVLREQVEGAAFLFQPGEAGSLADAILRLKECDSDSLALRLEAGHAIAQGCDEENSWKMIEGILKEFAARRRCWQ